MATKKFGYTMTASGYGSKTYRYATRDEALKEMKSDAQNTAGDCEGEVHDYGDEIVVSDYTGDEIARFEML